VPVTDNCPTYIRKRGQLIHTNTDYLVNINVAVECQFDYRKIEFGKWDRSGKKKKLYRLELIIQKVKQTIKNVFCKRVQSTNNNLKCCL